MATKTISIDIEAYEKLVQARSDPDESFSRVIKRARWKNSKKGAAAFFDVIRRHPPMSEEALARIEETQTMDKHGRDKWK